MRIGRDMTYTASGRAPAGLSEHEHKRWAYQRYIKDYLRCIASVDDNVGRCSTGSTPTTSPTHHRHYTSDQGFFLGDHGWYDKRFMYESRCGCHS